LDEVLLLRLKHHFRVENTALISKDGRGGNRMALRQMLSALVEKSSTLALADQYSNGFPRGMPHVPCLKIHAYSTITTKHKRANARVSQWPFANFG
jgi:hypothetical protein